MRLLLRWLILAFAIWLTAQLLPGMEVSGSIWSLLVVALVFGLINAIIRPIVQFLALPITILTLGLFALVINALMLWLTAALLPALNLTGGFFQNFVTVLLGSILISIVSSVLGWFLPDKD